MGVRLPGLRLVLDPLPCWGVFSPPPLPVPVPVAGAVPDALALSLAWRGEVLPEDLRGETRPFWREVSSFRVRVSREGKEHRQNNRARRSTNLLRPPQPTTIAQIAIPTGPPPPLRRNLRMTIRTVLLGVTLQIPPLPLLLPTQQRLQLLRQHAILSFHLPELELPARAARGLQLVEDVVLTREGFVLVPQREAATAGGGDDAAFGVGGGVRVLGAGEDGGGGLGGLRVGYGGEGGGGPEGGDVCAGGHCGAGFLVLAVHCSGQLQEPCLGEEECRFGTFLGVAGVYGGLGLHYLTSSVL